MSITWSTEYKSGRGNAAWADAGEFQFDLWKCTGGHRFKVHFNGLYVETHNILEEDKSKAMELATLGFIDFRNRVLKSLG